MQCIHVFEQATNELMLNDGSSVKVPARVVGGTTHPTLLDAVEEWARNEGIIDHQDRIISFT